MTVGQNVAADNKSPAHYYNTAFLTVVVAANDAPPNHHTHIRFSFHTNTARCHHNSAPPPYCRVPSHFISVTGPGILIIKSFGGLS